MLNMSNAERKVLNVVTHANYKFLESCTSLISLDRIRNNIVFLNKYV